MNTVRREWAVEYFLRTGLDGSGSFDALIVLDESVNTSFLSTFKEPGNRGEGDSACW